MAAVLRLWQLTRTGFGNPYYSATVRSMATGWHNFFFAAFDPGGYLSIDKPPVAFWIQTATSHILGFHPLALLLPSAVAGIGAVAILFVSVRRVFGTGPATVAATVLALTPITVATDRFNDPDALLTLLLVLAAWLLVRAAEGRGWSHVLIAGAVVGLACMTKSLAAVIPLPGFWLAYLVSPYMKVTSRLVRLAAATLILVVAALAWLLAVDAFPTGSRPRVGGTTTNSEINLLVGSNGLARLNGTAASPGLPGKAVAHSETAANRRYGDSGRPGPLRLIDGPLGGQASWPVAIAITGLVVAAADLRRRWRDPRLPSLVLWGGWLATEGVVLSAAGGLFHAYYLSAIAPPIAALTGIGAFALVRAWRHLEKTLALLPAALIGTGLIEWRALIGYPTFRGLGPVCLALTVLASIVLVLSVHTPQLRRIAAMFLGFGTVVAVIAPLAFTLSVLRHAGVAEIPVAGPPLDPPAAQLAKADSSARAKHEPISVVSSVAAPGGEATARLIAFLEANHHGERWILAMPTGLDAAPVITRSGLGVLALGGIDNAPVLPLTEFRGMIKGRNARFVELKLPLTGQRSLVDVEVWVQHHCAVVAPADWLPLGPPASSVELRDCSPTTGRLVSGRQS